MTVDNRHYCVIFCRWSGLLVLFTTIISTIAYEFQEEMQHKDGGFCKFRKTGT
jgi:hypothetical protein